jgi:hypothetical protein
MLDDKYQNSDTAVYIKKHSKTYFKLKINIEYKNNQKNRYRFVINHIATKKNSYNVYNVVRIFQICLLLKRKNCLKKK